MRVRNDELVLLSQIRGFAKLMVWQEALAAEVARRNIESSSRVEAAVDRNLAALGKLNASLDGLRMVTQESTAVTVAALGQLGRRLETLTESTDSWSRWLTRLTIAVVVFTAALVVVAIVQATRP
jgi:hypothetical protein